MRITSLLCAAVCLLLSSCATINMGLYGYLETHPQIQETASTEGLVNESSCVGFNLGTLLANYLRTNSAVGIKDFVWYGAGCINLAGTPIKGDKR